MCLAIPGKVITIEDRELRTARVDFGGVVKDACLEFVPEARVGDYVIVHAGFAISRVDEHEARRIFTYIAEIEAIDDKPGGSS